MRRFSRYEKVIMVLLIGTLVTGVGLLYWFDSGIVEQLGLLIALLASISATILLAYYINKS